MIKKCKNPWCGKEFETTNNSVKYCSKECAKFIHQKQKTSKIPLQISLKKCEWCDKEHDGKYGTGRFCCEKCKDNYVGNKNKKSSPKVKSHLEKLRQNGKIAKKSSLGTWKCNFCNEIFETRQSLKEHIQIIHNHIDKTFNKNGLYECPFCKKVFTKRQQLGGHILNCKKHPNKIFYDEVHKIQAKKLSERYKLYPVSEETKHKLSMTAGKRLSRTLPGVSPRYNVKSIQFLDNLSKENGWNLQHAENGGEFYTGIGFWVDAYDKERNIVVEYDEKFHYSDVENNILREKDLKRQKEIIEHLHCEFWRYNENLNFLYCVT